MSGMFTITATESLRTARSRIEKQRGRIADFKAAHLRAAILIQQWVFRNFKAQGAMHSSALLRWPPLAPATIRARVRRNLRTMGRGRNILGRQSAVPIRAGRFMMLQDTGTLRGGFVPSASFRSGKVENYVPYAPYHEYGTRHIPRRKMFPAIDQARTVVLPIFREHVTVSIR